jgi:hypothetical protein
MDKFPHEAWVRLGKALERRRGQLGYGFRRRKEFAEGKRLSAKTLSRLEHAERDAYPDDTLALAEVIYQWEPGSVESVLRGGDAVPLPGSPGTNGGPPDDRPPEVREHWDDANVRAIWELSVPRERRAAMLTVYLRPSPGADEANAAPARA